MKPIIPPVSREKIKAELNEDKFLRNTNNGNNKIYCITAHNAPNTMLEIGRLREITFRLAGGGTGQEVDIDAYDKALVPYTQLIVWCPETEQILGGYRYIICKNAPRDENNDFVLATSQLFHFSNNYKENYLPRMIELGRSFVTPEFQISNASRKGIFALDNLWDGLGALIVDNPDVEYFFGKVTMYPHYNQEARNMILYFMQKHFRDTENLISLLKPLEIEMDDSKMSTVFNGIDLKEDYKILNAQVRLLGTNIPPLINAYMNLSASMRMFGTSLNPYFGDVEETAILITIKDIYPSKVHRHIASYMEDKKRRG